MNCVMSPGSLYLCGPETYRVASRLIRSGSFVIRPRTCRHDGERLRSIVLDQRLAASSAAFDQLELLIEIESGLGNCEIKNEEHDEC